MQPTSEKTDIQTALRSGVPLFEGLPDDGLERAIDLARREKRAKDSQLFEQSAVADTFYLIIAGRIRVSQITPEGQQVIIRYLGPHDIAGCVAVCVSTAA